MDPAIVLLAMWALGLTSPTARVWLNIFVIIIGVTMTVLGEVKFVLSGFLFQIAGRVFESIRLALIQQILSGDEQKMDPLVSLYYFSPVCSVIIGFVFVFTELPRLRVHDIQQTGVGFLMANAAVAFLLNVAGVVLVGLSHIVSTSNIRAKSSTDREDICTHAPTQWCPENNLSGLRLSHAVGDCRDPHTTCRLLHRDHWVAVLLIW